MNILTRTIYLLSCKNPLIRDLYVGSTSNLINRSNVHANDALTKNSRLYRCIRDTGGFSNWACTPIETIIGTKLEARIIERHHCEAFHANLNTYKSYRSAAEARVYNQTHALQYYYENKPAISVQKRQYYLNNQDRLQTYNRNRYHQRLTAAAQQQQQH